MPLDMHKAQQPAQQHLLESLDELIQAQTNRVSRKRRKAVLAAARCGAPVGPDEMRLATAISHLDYLIEIKRALAVDPGTH